MMMANAFLDALDAEEKFGRTCRGCQGEKGKQKGQGVSATSHGFASVPGQPGNRQLWEAYSRNAA